jgi:hypothetical protein
VGGENNFRVTHTQSRWGFSSAECPKLFPFIAGDVPDVGGEVAQDGAEAGGQEAGAGEDGHLSPVIRHQGHFYNFQPWIQPLLLLFLRFFFPRRVPLQIFDIFTLNMISLSLSIV